MFQLFKKIKYLKDKGWYRSLTGNLVHPHMMTYFTNRELRKMSWEEIRRL